MDKHFNVDIEIAAEPRGDSPNHRYVVTFIEKDPKDQEKDKRVHAFWTYVSSEPLRVLTLAITDAHRYYGKRVLEERDKALKQIEELRTGIEEIQDQARKILDPKRKKYD
ncbi:MAG: hypothetical protein K2X66_10380 [Cyanobacteria bacterium]|nr:hypothetical protein [Cyanobacteriota bacterium]